MTLDALVRDRLHERMYAAARGIGNAVRPILRAKTKGGRAEPLGSCVLIRYKNVHLLVTAAHVVDHNEESALYIPVQGRLSKLEASGVITRAPESGRCQDRFDFSVLKLPSAMVSALGNVRYVGENEICSEQTHTKGRAHMALGYPISKNKKIDHVRRKVRPRRLPYGGTTVEDTKFAAKLGISGEDHLFIAYDKRSRDSEGRIVNSSDPTGMSGGALIDLGNLSHPMELAGLRDEPFRLAGILIEMHAADKRMVAVKIDTVLGGL
jgi:hypothetical protein